MSWSCVWSGHPCIWKRHCKYKCRSSPCLDYWVGQDAWCDHAIQEWWIGDPNSFGYCSVQFFNVLFWFLTHFWYLRTKSVDDMHKEGTAVEVHLRLEDGLLSLKDRRKRIPSCWEEGKEAFILNVGWFLFVMCHGFNNFIFIHEVEEIIKFVAFTINSEGNTSIPHRNFLAFYFQRLQK